MGVAWAAYYSKYLQLRGDREGGMWGGDRLLGIPLPCFALELIESSQADLSTRPVLFASLQMEMRSLELVDWQRLVFQ